MPFQWQIDLNQAIDVFWKRHIGKLRKHAAAPLLTGVANFLQILGCLQRALEYQQRVLIEKLRLTSLLRNDEWYKARALIDAILSRYRELTDLMWNRYWPALRKTYGAGAARDALKNGLAEIRRGYDIVLQWHREVEDTRRACQVITPYGRVEARYFPGNIPLKWSNYKNSLQSSVGTLLHALEAA